MLTRRDVLWILPVFPAGADEAGEVRDLFARLAEALSTSSAAEFLRRFDRRMPAYARLERDVVALLNQFEVSSSVELGEDKGDGRERTVEVDWMLELRSLAPTGPTLRRRATLRVTLVRRGKAWQITALEPADFFAPPAG